MKVYHLVLTATLFLSSYSLSHGQSMLKEGNQWNVFFYSGFSPGTSTQLFRVNGDTIINDLTYTTLFTARDTSGNNWVLHNEFIREDTTGKVFIKRTNEDEMLLLDFGMQVGEIFNPNGDTACNLEVSKVDSVFLNSGEKRKRLQFAGWPYTWIEGIGSLEGPLFRYYCLFDVGEALLCFSEEDEMLFPESPDFCFEETTSVQNQLPADVQVYPNPIHNTIRIEFSETIIQSYTLVNVMGQEILKGKLTGGSIDVSSVPVGTFVLLLRTRDGGVFSKKMIKLD